MTSASSSWFGRLSVEACQGRGRGRRGQVVKLHVRIGLVLEQPGSVQACFLSSGKSASDHPFVLVGVQSGLVRVRLGLVGTSITIEDAPQPPFLTAILTPNARVYRIMASVHPIRLGQRL